MDQLACCAAQVMLLIFLSIGTLLIACFLGYHCSLIVKGMTSYETFKWQDYKDHCKAVAQDSRYASLTKRWRHFLYIGIKGRSVLLLAAAIADVFTLLLTMQACCVTHFLAVVGSLGGIAVSEEAGKTAYGTQHLQSGCLAESV